jgi:glutamate-1-semialdehyde 2,1-aminomutase
MSHTTNKAAFERAQKVLPGGVNSPVRAFSAIGGNPPVIERGEGGCFYDVEGKRYIDYIQSWGPLILGHARKEVVDAVCEKAKKGLGFGTPTEIETDLAELVLEAYPFLEKLRFVSTGTEAVMTAIRLARGVTGKTAVIKFKGNYHGHSDSLLVQAGSGAATFGHPSSPGVPADFAKHTLVAEYNDLSAVEAFFKAEHDIACVVIEPIAGNMGLIPADEAFLQGLRKLCTDNGALLIFDEVMSGFRAGPMGACSHTAVRPDMVTFGKVIGGGMPVAAFGASAAIMSQLSPEGPVYQAGTLSGNPVAMAAGLATLKIVRETEGFYETLTKRAQMLTAGFEAAAKAAGVPLVTDVRGSMFGFFFSDKPVKNFTDAAACDIERFKKFYHEMLLREVYLAPSAFEAGFISLATDDDLIEETIAAAHEAMKAIA